jgi:hypothetical protein
MGIGLGTGIALRLPFFPWIFPKEGTPVLSSFAGALVGAGAAGFWAHHALTRVDREACRTVARAIRPVPNEMASLQRNLGADEVKPETIRSQLSALQKLVAQADERMKLLSTLHSQMREGKGVAIADAQIAFRDLTGKLTSAERRVNVELNRSPGPLAYVGTATNIAQISHWEREVSNLFSEQLRALLEAMRILGHPLDDVRDLYAD